MSSLDSPADPQASVGPDGASVSLPYTLRCRGCGATYEDDGYMLRCPADHEPALLISEYAQSRFEPDKRADGLFRFKDWLPARRVLPNGACTVTYQSDALSRLTGLSRLWIAFNGYWPDKGARLETGSFKELEAWTVLSRLPEPDGNVLVIASAGNTGAAFARICSLYDVPCVIIVPEGALPGLQFVDPIADQVKVVSLGGLADYYDAIQLAARVSEAEGFIAEGGVWNVGRRDGLGTVVLEAVETIGELPDYYFQAVGSGAGGIAAYEAAERLMADGTFGSTPPRLMLCQNTPFAPIFDSWGTGERRLVEYTDDTAKTQVQKLIAAVLSNRRPPFTTAGGVYDALTDTGGDVLIADNEEAVRAGLLFQQTEGIDIEPASAVAFAALLKAAADERIEPDALTVLNITGGGRGHLQATTRLLPVRPALELGQEDLLLHDAPDRVVELFHR